MSAEITAWLDDAQAKVDAATEGPWDIETDSNAVVGPTLSYAADRHRFFGVAEDVHLAGDREFIADTRTRLPQAIAALRAVLDAHAPTDALMNPGRQERVVAVCTGCGTDDGNWQRWPCPTARAIAAAIGVQP